MRVARLVLINLAFVVALFLPVDLVFTKIAAKKAAAQVEPGIPDPVFHHTFRPNFHAQRAWGQSRYDFATNSLGFKDRSVREVPLQSSSYRVLFLGDSFTEGIGVEYDKTWAGIFDRAVAASGIETLNAGVASYAPHWYYEKLKYYLDRGLTVDELFVFIDMSDIRDELKYADRWNPQWEPETSWGERAEEWVGQHLSLTYLAYVSLIKPFEAKETWVEDWTRNQAAFAQWGHLGLDSATSYMEKIVELCAQRDIRLHIAVYPWPRQILERDDPSMQETHWRAFALKHDIGFLDLFPNFRPSGVDPAQVVRTNYVSADVHWNERGNALVAEGLLNYWRALPPRR